MMSLDTIPAPVRSGPYELVPSRYALQVGEIDVLVVSDGVLPLPGEMLGHNADPAVRTAWLNDCFLPPDVLDWALNVVVARSGARTILIDARSEEPTSELQSLLRISYAVFCLTKKTTTNYHPETYNARWN